MSAWFFLCRRCSHHRPLSRRPSAAHEPFREGLPRFWADYQLEENTGHGSECGLTFQHYNLGTWTGGCQWLRISDTLSLDSELNKRIGKAATTRILHARQEKKLNTFHMCCLRRILNMTRQDRVPNDTVLERAEIPLMYTLLKQRRLRWFSHAVRMDNGPFPKNLLYGKLANGKRPPGRPQLRY